MPKPKTICIYHQLHQPFRVNQVEKSGDVSPKDYFVGPNPGKKGGDYSNRHMFERVALKSYIPATHFWHKMLKTYPQLRLTLSFSGTFLEQCLTYEKYGIQVIKALQELVSTGQVELLSETYYHSLCFLYDLEEFLLQIRKHRDLIKLLFDYETVSFRNTEIIYNDHIGAVIRELGFESIVGAKLTANMRDPFHNIATIHPYTLSEQEKEVISNFAIGPQQHTIPILFSEKETSGSLFFLNQDAKVDHLFLEYPGQIVTLFTDFEIYGEHNTEEETGMFTLMANLLKKIDAAGIQFGTVTEVSKTPVDDVYACPTFTTWANNDHDLRSWVGNPHQNHSHREMARLLGIIRQLPESPRREELFEMWRKLSTSDHYYYMPILDNPADAISHALFSPYDNQTQAYEYFQNALSFLENTIYHISDSFKPPTLLPLRDTGLFNIAQN